MHLELGGEVHAQGDPNDPTHHGDKAKDETHPAHHTHSP